MDDLNFQFLDKKGYIIVTADSIEILRSAFDHSIRVQVVFDLLTDSRCDDVETKAGFATANLSSFSSSSDPQPSIEILSCFNASSDHQPCGSDVDSKSEKVSKSQKKKQKSPQKVTETEGYEVGRHDNNREELVELASDYMYEAVDLSRIKTEHSDEFSAQCYSHETSNKGKESSRNCKFSCKIARYECVECGKMFVSEAVREKHMMRNHRILKCDVCSEFVQGGTGYQKHRIEQHGLAPANYVCAICGHSFDTRRELSVHKKSHKDQPVDYRCKYCELMFKNITDLNNHNKVAQHGIYCLLCKEVFKTKSLLSMHLKDKHLEDKDEAGNLLVRQCTDCSRVFFSEKKLQLHKQTHFKNKRKWICDLCQTRFSNLHSLKNHLKWIHDPSVDEMLRFPCEVCGMLVSRFNISAHNVLHKEGIFKCKICSKTFRWRHGLTRHMLTHTKEKPHQCEICSKCFSQGTNLTIHMRTHTKDKPFSCQYCDLAFSHKCTLQGHIARKHRLGNIEEKKGWQTWINDKT